MQKEPPTLIELATDFAKASGLRRKDLQRIRRNHIIDDPFTDEILIVLKREDEDHLVPILLDHEDVALYLLKEHRKDEDLWFPVIPAEIDCDASRQYYAQQLYEQLEQFQSPFNRKGALLALADILEEPLYGIIKRYGLTRTYRKTAILTATGRKRLLAAAERKRITQGELFAHAPLSNDQDGYSDLDDNYYWTTPSSLQTDVPLADDQHERQESGRRHRRLRNHSRRLGLKAIPEDAKTTEEQGGTLTTSPESDKR